MNTTTDQTTKEDFIRETAKISWSELLKFFAAGNAVFVDKSLNLVEAAMACRQDKAEIIKKWMEDKLLYAVSDEQAKKWLANEEIVWAVVVAPWVLVQEQRTTEENLPD